MADSHLPNDHPSITPGWKPRKYPTIPLRDALKTTLLSGTDNVFQANIPQSWSVPGIKGYVVFGGFCASLILSTSRKYFQLKYGARKQSDPLHVHVQFISELPMGLCDVVIKDLKIGAKQSIIQVELKKSGSFLVSVLGIVTMGSYSEKGHTIETPRFEIPDIKECQRWTEPTFYYLNPASSQYRSWTSKGGPNPLWSPSAGQNRRDMWVKLDDEGESMGIQHLGTLIDQVPPLPLNYEKHALGGMAKWNFPTMCLNIDIKRDPGGEEFFLQRTAMHHCSNGRFDMEVKIIDVKGKLVATSTHSNLIFARGREKSAGKTAGASKL